MMKRSILLFVAISTALSIDLQAQSELSAFTSTGRAGVSTTFVTDYQCVGINPANLGWKPSYEGKKVTTSTMEFTFSLYSAALSKPDLRETFIKGTNTRLTSDEKKQAAKEFADAPMAMNINVNTFSLAAQFEKVGGFALVVRERVQWYSVFNPVASDILFNGYNASYFDVKLDTAGNNVTDSANAEKLTAKGVASKPGLYSDVLGGSKVQATWLREFNLSYGRYITQSEDFSLYAGVGLKYLVGMGIVDISIDNNGFRGYSSLSPSFNIDYGTAALTNPSYLPQDSTSTIPKPVGSGFGADIGISIIIKEKFKLGVAVADIGSVTWTGNVFTAQDDTISSTKSGGWDSYNVIKESKNFFGDGTFAWVGDSRKKVPLPTVLRAGASYKFGEALELGADMIMPFNDFSGSYQNAFFGVGADIKPFKWLILSTGFTTGGNYGFNLPVGLRIAVPTGTWEFGIASRDAITFFSDNAPTISLSTGFLRFRF